MPRQQSQVLRRATTVAVGAGIGQLLVLVSSPILSRVFDPSDFGVFGVVTSIESIVVVAAALRYELAVPLPKDDEDASALVFVGGLAVIGWAVLTALVLIPLAPLIADWTNSPAVTGVAMLIPLVLLADGLGNVLAYWSIRRKRFGHLAASRAAQGAGQSAGQIALGAAGTGAAGLVVGYGIGKAVNTFWLAWDAIRGPGRLARPAWSSMRRVASRYRRFPLVSSWAAIVNSAGLQLPAILLAAWFTPEAAGWFLLANRVVVGPATIFGQAGAQAFHGDLARMAHTREQRLLPSVRHFVSHLAVLGVVPALLLMVFGPWAAETIFGSDWRTAGEFIRILAPAYFLQFVVSPLGPVLVVLERQGIQAAWDVFRLVMVVASLWVPVALGWSATDAIGIFSLQTIISYVVIGVLILVVVGRDDTARCGPETADGTVSKVDGSPGQR